MRIWIAIAALLMGLTTANAQIAGQNDLQLKAALAQWLEGEDLAALTSLSELAKADNRAAQVFLGRVNEATHTHSHVTGPMERKARIALMRQVGGLSGKSWLKTASQDVPLAVAFLQVKTTWESPDAITTLIDMGEINTALMPLAMLLSNGKISEAKQILTHPNLPDHSIYLLAAVARANYFATRYAGFLGSAKFVNALNWKLSAEEIQNLKFMWEGFRWDEVKVGEASRMIPDAIPTSLIDSPHYAPLKALCSARCGHDVPKCMRATMIRLYDATPIWITLSSPVETILSTNDYHSSPRITDDLVRLLKMTKLFSSEFSKELDQCSYQIIVAD